MNARSLLDDLSREGWTFRYDEQTGQIVPSKPADVTDAEVFRVRGAIREQREAVVLELQADALTGAMLDYHGGLVALVEATDAGDRTAFEDAYDRGDLDGMRGAFSRLMRDRKRDVA